MSEEPVTIDDFAEVVAQFEERRRRRFYEALAHNLTISGRVVSSDGTLTDAEKVERLKWLNEVQHRVLVKLMNPAMCSDIEFLTDLCRRELAQCRAIAGDVGWALKQSLESSSVDYGAE